MMISVRPLPVTPQTRIAYLGPDGSYSSLAARQYFGNVGNFIPCRTIPAVFEAMCSHEADYGIVPVENSTDGRIIDTMVAFTIYRQSICAEIAIQIDHALLSRSLMSEIREIHSKPQAISQCRTWIAEHLPNAILCDAPSTTAAAALAMERPEIAAIGPVSLVNRYPLNILADSIQDDPENHTRFLVLGESPASPTAAHLTEPNTLENAVSNTTKTVPRTALKRSEIPLSSGKSSYKTAVLLKLPHRCGSLADALSIFRVFEINLSRIESFPVRGLKNHYWFYIEFEGHKEFPLCHSVITTLELFATEMILLGSYPTAE